MIYEIFRVLISVNFLVFLVVGVFGGIVVSQYRRSYTSSLDCFDSFIILFESGDCLNDKGKAIQKILKRVFLVSGLLFLVCFSILALVLSK